jgi:hypothetical protein
LNLSYRSSVDQWRPVVGGAGPEDAEMAQGPASISRDHQTAPRRAIRNTWNRALYRAVRTRTASRVSGTTKGGSDARAAGAAATGFELVTGP